MSHWNAWSYCFLCENICLNHSRCIHEIEFGSVGFIYCDLFKIWKLYRVVNWISVLPMEYLNRLKCKCPLTHRDSLSRIMHGIQTFVYIIEIQRKQWYKINMSIEHWKCHGVNSNYTPASPERVFTCGESFIKPNKLGKWFSRSVNFPSNGKCAKWKTSM